MDIGFPELSIKFKDMGKSNRIKEKIDTFKAEASRDLQKTVSQINKFEAKLVGDRDKVAKTTITSPVDGIIKQINFNN